MEVLATSEVNVVAKAKRYGRWWLLKGLQKKKAGEAGYQQRLRKEFEILMQLQHPYVVAAYGIEDVEGLGRCIVMEYADGPTLREWLEGTTTRQSRLAIVSKRATPLNAASSLKVSPFILIISSRMLNKPFPTSVVKKTGVLFEYMY